MSGLPDAKSLRGFTIGAKDGDACIDWLKERGLANFRKFQSSEKLVKAAAIKDVRDLCIDTPPARRCGMDGRCSECATL
ncbi:MAG TPA: hypothetical protein VKD04_01925 [Burkholderiales bacterium]|nr:hypothetical protein [Burkholderiales bacterium]